MKKDAYYFSHDSNAKDDPKCALLFESIGAEGYGIYWVLIEILREQPNYEYPLALLGSVARKYNTDKDIVLTVIRAFDLFKYDDDVFYSESLKARMEIVNQKRSLRSHIGKRANDVRWGKCNQADSATRVIHDGSQVDPKGIHNESQLKEIKEKEIKEKEIKDGPFKKPSLVDIENYCKERNSNINPSSFLDHYDANGWVIGKNRTPMKDWKAAVRTWERNSIRTSLNLGVGEYLNADGQRTYGTAAIVPDNAPPRPSDKHCWNKLDNEWRRY